MGNTVGTIRQPLLTAGETKAADREARAPLTLKSAMVHWREGTSISGLRAEALGGKQLPQALSLV